MARFDIYANPGKNQKNIPYLVDVQSNVISGLASRIVIPLRTLSSFSGINLPADLFPLIDVNGTSCILDTPQLGAIPLRELKAKVGSAKAQQAAIQVALDRAFGAY
jgi:toxin CcdB